MSTGMQLPLPLDPGWPVGARLRFRLDAVLRPGKEYLRGTPVLVLSAPALLENCNERRQYLTAFGARCPAHRFGWARPAQLEPIPGEDMLPATTKTHRHRPASTEPGRQRRHCVTVIPG